MAHPWLDTTEYPFHSNYYSINNHNIHFIDEGKGNTVLFVHGTPSWSFDFRNIIKKLKPDYRCVAIDHMGFGLSDKPEHYDYSTQNHSKTLERFILDKNLTNITLVVHDFGGPIGLNVAIQHPDRIKKIVILNTWLWTSKDDPDFKKFSKILKSPLLPFLYRYLNFSARFILPRSFGDEKIKRKTLRQFTRPFSNKTQRNGTLAFAKSLLNDQHWFEDLWSKKDVISNKPTLFVWGMKDPVIKPLYLDKFLTGFPHSHVVRLETCGHFPQEEQSEITGTSIRDFIKQNS
ncbi:MAG: alpha/beta fold hydrolase [Flavobacteriales bacterium]